MQMGGARQKHNAEGGREAKKFKNHWSIEYHSICNLYLMELSVTHSTRDQNINNDDGNNDMESALSNTVDKSVRPKRKATERFHKMLKDNIDYL